MQGRGHSQLYTYSIANYSQNDIDLSEKYSKHVFFYHLGFWWNPTRIEFIFLNRVLPLHYISLHTLLDIKISLFVLFV